MGTTVFDNDIEEIIISDDNEDDFIESTPTTNYSNLRISSVVSCPVFELDKHSTQEEIFCSNHCTDSQLKINSSFSHYMLGCNASMIPDGSQRDRNVSLTRIEHCSESGFSGTSADRKGGCLTLGEQDNCESVQNYASMTDVEQEREGRLLDGDHDYCNKLGFQCVPVSGNDQELEQNLSFNEHYYSSESDYNNLLAEGKHKTVKCLAEDSSTSVENKNTESSRNEHTINKKVNPVILLIDAIINASGECLNFQRCTVQDILNMAIRTVNKLVTEERKLEHTVELLLQENYNLKRIFHKLNRKETVIPSSSTTNTEFCSCNGK